MLFAKYQVTIYYISKSIYSITIFINTIFMILRTFHMHENKGLYTAFIEEGIKNAHENIYYILIAANIIYLIQWEIFIYRLIKNEKNIYKIFLFLRSK